MHLRTNDVVEVIAGDDKGVRSKVTKINHEAGKITVEQVNLVYKHVRRSQKNPQGGRLNKEMPIQISNVLLVCTKCSKATRTGSRKTTDGLKERFCRKCGAALGEIKRAKEKNQN